MANKILHSRNSFVMEIVMVYIFLHVI